MTQNIQNIQINAQLAAQAVEQAARNQIAKAEQKRKNALSKLTAWKLVKTLVAEALTEALAIVVERNPKVAKAVKVITVTSRVVVWTVLAPIRLVRWVRSGGIAILAKNVKNAILNAIEVSLVWTALAPLRLIRWIACRGLGLAIWLVIKALWKAVRWILSIGTVSTVTVINANEQK